MASWDFALVEQRFAEAALTAHDRSRVGPGSFANGS